MAVVELTKDNFEEVVTNNDFVIVDFWAPWCGPCRSFAPTYEKVSGDHADVVFAKVNTEDEQEIAGHFQIRSIPTLMIFREKIIIFSEAGALPESAGCRATERPGLTSPALGVSNLAGSRRGRLVRLYWDLNFGGQAHARRQCALLQMVGQCPFGG
jgi:thioredoxin 1